MLAKPTMISLVGEQPIPNLLPILHPQLQPQRIVLVYTERTKTVSECLQSVLEDKSVSVEAVEVDPYDMVGIESKLNEVIKEKNLPSDAIIFNLTGGTKPMAFAAYRLAEQLSAAFLYVQSEEKKSVVYRYRLSKRGLEPEKEEVSPVLDIDIYLKAHPKLRDYTSGGLKDEFEQMVAGVLEKELDEVKTSVKAPKCNLEIDLVVRCGNNVGIAEVKSGNKAKEKRGVEQIIAAAENRFLGTYTRKFLILDRKYESNNKRLAEAHGITVIELLSAQKQKGELSEEDKKKLVGEVKGALGG